MSISATPCSNSPYTDVSHSTPLPVANMGRPGQRPSKTRIHNSCLGLIVFRRSDGARNQRK